MVIAGGPLHIYSSDDLLHWTCESTYPDLHTECPDLYPIRTDGGTVKWVLSRGGRFYKVGGCTVAGAEQIFPKADSQGIRVIVEGGAAKADITVYPMNSIWKNSINGPWTQSAGRWVPVCSPRKMGALRLAPPSHRPSFSSA